MKDIIKKQQDHGNNILLTSHNYADIEGLCDISYIILDGNLMLLAEDISN